MIDYSHPLVAEEAFLDHSSHRAFPEDSVVATDYRNYQSFEFVRTGAGVLQNFVVVFPVLDFGAKPPPWYPRPYQGDRRNLDLFSSIDSLAGRHSCDFWLRLLPGFGSSRTAWWQQFELIFR